MDSAATGVNLTVGYTRNNTGYDDRIFASAGENVLCASSADAVGSQWATFHAQIRARRAAPAQG